MECTAASSDEEETEEELEELCRLASDLPGLWHHPVVTHQERKEILHCLIDRIVVSSTKERIDATIRWKNGETTPFVIWRATGRYNLIRELHAQNLTILEIKDHLAAGKTSTGQVYNISVARLYRILDKLGLKANRFPASYLSLREKAVELNRDGRSVEWIAKYFNEHSFRSASGKPWTSCMAYNLIRAKGHKTHRLEDLHRGAILEARARGLNYRQMAAEFNLRGIRRRDGQSWTALSVKDRWSDLNQLKRNRLTEVSAKSSDPTTEEGST